MLYNQCLFEVSNLPFEITIVNISTFKSADLIFQEAELLLLKLSDGPLLGQFILEYLVLEVQLTDATFLAFNLMAGDLCSISFPIELIPERFYLLVAFIQSLRSFSFLGLKSLDQRTVLIVRELKSFYLVGLLGSLKLEFFILLGE